MSYSLSECQNYFSPMQIAKMIYYKNIMNPAYPTFNISGPDRLCAGATATYTVTSLPGVSEYQWTVPTSMTILSSPPYSNSILVQASHSTGGQISVLPDCGSKPAYFWVKDTGSVDVTGFDTGCPNETYTYSVPFISGATYYWNPYENAQIVSGQNTNTVQVKLLPGASNKSYIIATVGICGNIYGHKQILHGDPPPPAPQCFAPTGGEDNKILQIPVQDFILYPNPAENSVTVVVPGDSEYTLTIWDIQGKMLYSEVILNNIEHIINTSAYNSGVYFVSLTDNEEGKTLTKRLIIKK